MREFNLPWRKADSPNHHDDIVDLDQEVVSKELSLPGSGGSSRYVTPDRTLQTTVERLWHIQYSRGQILALAFMFQVLPTVYVVASSLGSGRLSASSISNRRK